MRYIYYFSLTNNKIISDYKHVCKVQQLFAENEGIRLCFIDERHDTFIFNPAHDLITQVFNATPLVHVYILSYFLF